MSTDKSNPYHKSPPLEFTILEFFGNESKWNGIGPGFVNVKYIRKAMLAVVKKIRKRVADIITDDDRLLITTTGMIDAIEKEASALSNENNGLLEIVAYLLHLVALLLGYDWLKGKPNRHVIYYQTADQKLIDDNALHSDLINFYSRNKENYKKYEIVNNLYDELFCVEEIARIMNMSESLVKEMLIDSGKRKRLKKLSE
jgi:hypothetical protein